MAYAIVRDGAVVAHPIARGMYVDSVTKIATAWDSIDGMSDADRRAMGVYRVEETAPSYDTLAQMLGDAVYTVEPERVVKSFQIVDRPFSDAVKDEAWAEVRTWRETRKFDPFQFQGQWFRADYESQRLITGAYNMALAAVVTSQPYSNAWGAEDDSKVPVDAAGMLALGAVLGARTQALWEDADAAWGTISRARTATGCRTAVTAYKTKYKAVALLKSGDNPGALASDPYTIVVQI